MEFTIEGGEHIGGISNGGAASCAAALEEDNDTLLEDAHHDGLRDALMFYSLRIVAAVVRWRPKRFTMLSPAKKLAVFALFGLALPRCSDLFPSNSVSGDAAVALTCTAFAVAASGATGSPGLVCSLGSGTFTTVETCATSCSSPNVAICNAGNLNPSSYASFMSYACNGTTYYSLSQADIATAVSQGIVTCTCNPCDPSTGATCP